MRLRYWCHLCMIKCRDKECPRCGQGWLVSLAETIKAYQYTIATTKSFEFRVKLAILLDKMS